MSSSMKRHHAPRLSIIIPALNEGRTIRGVISSIPEPVSRFSEILVIDGGSADNTASEARRADARVITDLRKGKGAAMRRGIDEAIAPLCLFLDADGSMNPAEIGRFLGAMEGRDLVLGSRFIEKVDGRTHVVGNSFMNIFASALFLRRITDINSGFKLIRTAVAKELRLESAGFEIEAEMLLKVIKHGFRFAEVPITTRVRVHGNAKLSAIRDGYRIILEILRVRLLRSYPLPKTRPRRVPRPEKETQE